ncbi:DUF924 family protein [Phaeovibrio sulfidiphilus]|uniref:DUF924 family protein n=1 Tax=Phaeovibrio sulfidiphilus TaxID=1220600 RepID=A0A8J7CCU3_9PROT|nr:DUF924 family protein [Phaeovibrio sulfidiphilus]MBE1236154.1 DUF924 family protein [Phaeovibrio sulfidiphilus]
MSSTTDRHAPRGTGSALLEGWPLGAVRALLNEPADAADGPRRALDFWFAWPDAPTDTPCAGAPERTGGPLRSEGADGTGGRDGSDHGAPDPDARHPNESEWEKPRRWWFEPADSLDAALIALFSTDVGRARRGEFDDRFSDPREALGGIILLHSLPLRLWRGSDRAGAGNAKACGLALDLVRSGADRLLSPLERAVSWTPLLESPREVDAERALALYETLGSPFWIRRAEHRLAALAARQDHPDAAGP